MIVHCLGATWAITKNEKRDLGISLNSKGLIFSRHIWDFFLNLYTLCCILCSTMLYLDLMELLRSTTHNLGAPRLSMMEDIFFSLTNNLFL